KSIILTLLFSGRAFGAHYLLSRGLGDYASWTATDHTLGALYTFMAISTLDMVEVILLAKLSMHKNMGCIFLGLTLIKGIASYIYIQDGLGISEDKFIELNFLAAFFAFLFFDVYMAYRSLNQVENIDS